jgi:hypothetical protein
VDASLTAVINFEEAFGHAKIRSTSDPECLRAGKSQRSSSS